MSPPTPQGTLKSASERREGRENPAPISLQFSPWKKNIPCFYLLPASAPVLLAPALFPSRASLPLQLRQGTLQALSVRGPKSHLPRGPLWAPDRSRPGRKVWERGSRWARAARVCERGRAGRRASSRRAHSLGLSHHGLCVLLHWRFHTQICFPISNLQLYNKRFLCTKTVVIRPSANRMWNRRWLHAREILF